VLAAEQAILDLQAAGSTVIIATHIPERMYSLSAHITNLDGGKVIPSETLNVFDGVVRHEQDITVLELENQVRITVATEKTGSARGVLHPYDVILSEKPVVSSMRNSFKAVILEITDRNDLKVVKLDAGFTLYAYITPASLREMKLAQGSEVYASFKATAVNVLVKP
jgi:molybdopterin-binding protein